MNKHNDNVFCVAVGLGGIRLFYVFCFICCLTHSPLSLCCIQTSSYLFSKKRISHCKEPLNAIFLKWNVHISSNAKSEAGFYPKVSEQLFLLELISRYETIWKTKIYHGWRSMHIVKIHSLRMQCNTLIFTAAYISTLLPLWLFAGYCAILLSRYWA